MQMIVLCTGRRRNFTDVSRTKFTEGFHGGLRQMSARKTHQLFRPEIQRWELQGMSFRYPHRARQTCLPSAAPRVYLGDIRIGRAQRRQCVPRRSYVCHWEQRTRAYPSHASRPLVAARQERTPGARHNAPSPRRTRQPHKQRTGTPVPRSRGGQLSALDWD